MTIQGLLDQCARCQTHPATYNFSYVTEQTFRGVLTGFHYPEPGMNPFMIPTALYIGHKKFDKPVYSGFRASDWWHNDGLVSVYSQMFPRIAGSHPVGGAIGSHTRREQVLLGQNRVDELVRHPALRHAGDPADRRPG